LGYFSFPKINQEALTIVKAIYDTTRLIKETTEISSGKVISTETLEAPISLKYIMMSLGFKFTQPHNKNRYYYRAWRLLDKGMALNEVIKTITEAFEKENK
jgi:hypothetical protein